MIGRRPDVRATGPGSVAAERIDGGVSTKVDVFGSVSIPLEVARLDPRSVFADAEVEGFVGRRWLTERLDDFLVTRRAGYVWLEADAGLGKTAFAAWLVRTRGYVGHFSRQSSAGVTGALQNLAAQVITGCGLEEVAPGGMLPGWAVSGHGFGSLLHKAVSARRDRLVLVIDGLDEIGEPETDGLPLGLPPALPDGVFVVGTYRTGYRPGVPACESLPLRISQDDADNRGDLYTYLGAAATEEVLAAKLAECGLGDEAFCQLAVQRCGGVWVYLRYLLSEIRLGLRRADEWDDLPGNLWDFYLRQLQRWQRRTDWPQLQPVLATLAAVTEPVDVSLLSRLSGVNDRMLVRRCCDLWVRPFLTVEGGHARRYAIYHASFRQFLSGQLAPARRGESLDQAPVVAEQLHEAVTLAHGRIADHHLGIFGGLDTELDKLAAEPGLGGTDNGYPLRNLARHLQRAGRGEDLHRLLTCSRAIGPGRAVNVWFDTHDHAATLDVFLHDVDRARGLAEAITDAQVRSGRPPHGLGREVLYALMSASVHTMTNNVNLQLLLALVTAGVWEHTRSLGHARRLANPAERAEALAVLTPQLPIDQQPAVLAEALRAATAITNEYARTRALTGLAPHLPADQQPAVLAEALRAATAITNEYARAQALTGLAPHLPVDQLAEALRAATAITGEYARARALTGLAPHLPVDQLAEALRAATAITDEYARAEALTGLAPQLPIDQQPAALAEALQEATAITSEYFRAQALTGLAPHLPADQQAEALRAATAITDEYARAQALTGLAPHLPADQLAGVLRVSHVHDSQLVETVLARLRELQTPVATRNGMRVLRLALQRKHRASCLLAIGESAGMLSDDAGSATLAGFLVSVRNASLWWP
jgi:hypothetical protein